MSFSDTSLDTSLLLEFTYCLYFWWNYFIFIFTYISPIFLFSGHGYRRQASLTSSTTGVYRSSRRWVFILHLNIARWEMFTKYFLMKDQLNYWWVWNKWKGWISETICNFQRSPSIGPSQEGFHQRNILPHWWVITGFIFVIFLDLFMKSLQTIVVLEQGHVD